MGCAGKPVQVSGVVVSLEYCVKKGLLLTSGCYVQMLDASKGGEVW
jgi:hypothetical protein